MKITVNARKVFVNQKLTEHIEKKLAKFDKFFPGEAEASVKLSRVRDVERVEVTIQSGTTLFRSEDESSTFMNALDCCLYAIERQIRKNRYCLTYENQYFEIDVYPFWNDKAIVEIELSDENAKIIFPEKLKVIKEVTDDDSYKNASISKV